MMLRKRTTLIGLALAWIAAAAPSGNAQTPTPPTGGTPPPPAVGDTLRFKPATAAESLLAVPPAGAGEVWTLARCIQTALTQNAQVVAARAVTQRASGSALSAWNGIIPSLSADADYAQLKRTNTTTPFTTTFQATDPTTGALVDGEGIRTKQEQGSISASLSSNIISGPAIGEKKRRDRLSGAAQSDEAEVRNLVVYQVKSQYFELLKADRLAVVARDTERLARDEETRAEALFSVGTVARGDVLKARARRSTTQADRLRAENQVQIQAARLKRILGVSVGTSLAVEPILDQGIVIPDSAASIQQALTARPRIAAAQAAEQAAKSGVFGAKSQRLPVISGALGVSRSKSDETLDNLTVNNQPVSGDVSSTYYATDWSGQFRASLPLFDTAIEGSIRQAKANLLEAETNKRQRALDVTVEVQEAWLTLREAVQRIEVAREGLESAEEDYKFSKGRYDLGAGTYLELLTAEVQLAQVKTRLVEALADARVAEAGLEFAIGAKRY